MHFIHSTLQSYHFLPDLRFHRCSFNRQSFKISVHKFVESLNSFRFRIKSTSFISGKYTIVQEFIQSLSVFLVDKISSQKRDTPCAALSCG